MAVVLISKDGDFAHMLNLAVSKGFRVYLAVQKSVDPDVLVRVTLIEDLLAVKLFFLPDCLCSILLSSHPRPP